ncbi:MAG: ABC transporter permease, partial [Chthoniobacteraceae bacterium]
LPFRPDTSAIAMALLASAGASFVGVLGAVRQAVRLPPAEAMRPEPPAEFKPSIFERIGLHRFVSTSFRMALRNLERRPWQAIFTGLGLALATGIPVVPGAMRDGINHLLGFQWDSAQRQDVTVSLQEPGSATALSDLRHLPGVVLAEPFRSVPARLRFGHRTRRLGVTGLVRGATLNRLLDHELNRVPLPPDGLLVSAKLAELLGAKPGDTIILEVLEGDRPNREAVIHGLITDYAGIAAYMEIDSLRRLMQEGGTVSGAHLSVDRNQWGAFLREVKETPRIASLMIKDAVRASFEKTTAQTISLLQGLYFTFSVVVAFGVVYNSARIALSERSRDLATLRVIGFTNAEVAGVLIGELLMLTVLALPVGLLLGSGIAATIISNVNTESVRLPLVLSAKTYSTAIVIVLVSASISFAIVGQRVRQLDLLSVLKARE